MTIEVEGPADEVGAWLSKLPSGATSSTMLASVDWTDDLADRLVSRISDRAREALAIIADATIIDGDGAVSFDRVQREMGVDGVTLGGIFASFGFAERAGIPKPFETDKERRTYAMDPHVARLVVDAIIRHSER